MTIINMAGGGKGYDGPYTLYDYSAMRGPCNTGFHIPTNSELSGLKTVMTYCGLTTGNSWRINLHLPFSKFRYYTTGNVFNATSGMYWSSSPGGCLNFNESSVYSPSGDYKAQGMTIRPFKDIYVKPTSNRTTIMGAPGSFGIYWDTVNGLISITSDWVSGYTISDKNLGATTVYNNGDALSEANCGKFYQWGNNYGFPRTGSITTSSSKVDASGYGPGNYYSSNTFIIGNTDRSSVTNNDLRGGTTGIQTKEYVVIEGNNYIKE